MAQRLNNNFQFVEVGRQDPAKKIHRSAQSAVRGDL